MYRRVVLVLSILQNYCQLKDYNHDGNDNPERIVKLRSNRRVSLQSLTKENFVEEEKSFSGKKRI